MDGKSWRVSALVAVLVLAQTLRALLSRAAGEDSP